MLVVPCGSSLPNPEPFLLVHVASPWIHHTGFIELAKKVMDSMHFTGDGESVISAPLVVVQKTVNCTASQQCRLRAREVQADLDISGWSDVSLIWLDQWNIMEPIHPWEVSKGCWLGVKLPVWCWHVSFYGLRMVTLWQLEVNEFLCPIGAGRYKGRLAEGRKP